MFHLYDGSAVLSTLIALRKMMDLGLFYPTSPTGLLVAAISRSVTTLETLVLNTEASNRTLDLTRSLNTFPSRIPAGCLPFRRLTHLELLVDMTPGSLNLMARLLPSLSPVHLGVNSYTSSLLSKSGWYPCDLFVCIKWQTPFSGASVKRTSRCRRLVRSRHKDCSSHHIRATFLALYR